MANPNGQHSGLGSKEEEANKTIKLSEENISTKSKSERNYYIKGLIMNETIRDTFPIEKETFDDGSTIFIFYHSAAFVIFYFDVPTEQYTIEYQKLIFDFLRNSNFTSVSEKTADDALESGLTLDFQSESVFHLSESKLKQIFSNTAYKQLFKLNPSKSLLIHGQLWDPNPMVKVKAIYENLANEVLIKANEFQGRLAETILDGIKKMGFKSTKLHNEDTKKVNSMNETVIVRRTMYLFAINDSCNECGKEWSTFPVLMIVSEKAIEIKIIFAVHSKPGSFLVDRRLKNIKSDRYLKEVLLFLKECNKYLENSCFVYEASKNQVIYKTSMKPLFPIYENFKISQILTSEAITMYTAYAYGIYKIYFNMQEEVRMITSISINNSDSEKINLSDSARSEQVQEISTSSILDTEGQSIIKKCKERAARPVVKFSLLGGTSEFSASGKKSIWIRDIDKEKQIIDQIKKSRILSKVFLVDAISIKGNINYPKYFKNKAIESIQSKINSSFFKEILELIKELKNIDLLINYEDLKNHFIFFKKGVWFSFQVAISSIVENYSDDLYYKTIKDIDFAIIDIIKEGSWSHKIIGILEDESNFNFGEDTTKIDLLQEPKITPSSISIESVKKYAVKRYLINLEYFNQYLIRYFGLTRRYEIISELKISGQISNYKINEQFNNLKKLLDHKKLPDFYVLPQHFIVSQKDDQLYIHVIGNELIVNFHNEELSIIKNYKKSNFEKESYPKLSQSFARFMSEVVK